jgi:PIN domain nuclease of toxin-antitoxin system
MLLDTHALLWFGAGQGLSARGRELIAAGLRDGTLLVSAITAWEIGRLAGSGRIGLSMPARTWFLATTAQAGMQVVPLDAEIALAATDLPGEFHRDPADRFLVATARSLGVPIVTRDAAILAYAASGHVRALAC